MTATAKINHSQEILIQGWMLALNTHTSTTSEKPEMCIVINDSFI